MKKALGTTENVEPVLTEAFEHAAMPLTAEQRELALKCWKDSVCETGHGTLTVAYADGFGENVWRRVTAMEFIAQALTYPDVKKIIYTSARGDASKAIADMRSYIAQKVDVIVMFADAGEALLPTVKEATEAGILVTVHNGTSVGGEAGKDYVASIAEDVCKLGTDFVKAVADNTGPTGIVELGGTPGNPLSATWQACAEKEVANHAGSRIIGKADTNWTQEGNFEAVSGLLAQHDDIGAYIYEYADGFRGALRAYEAAGKTAEDRRGAAHRRAGPVLRLGKGQRSGLQDLLFVRPELPVALRADRGDDEEGRQGGRAEHQRALHDEAGRQGHVQSRPAARDVGFDADRRATC